jgi:hypothetical protein
MFSTADLCTCVPMPHCPRFALLTLHRTDGQYACVKLMLVLCTYA